MLIPARHAVIGPDRQTTDPDEVVSLDDANVWYELVPLRSCNDSGCYWDGLCRQRQDTGAIISCGDCMLVAGTISPNEYSRGNLPRFPIRM